MNKLHNKHSSQNLELKTQNLGMEDFWSRQTNAQTESFEFAPFGVTAKITANRSDVLAAARLSAGRFSRATGSDSQPMRIRIVVRSETTRTMPPDLPARLVYSGVGDWVSLSGAEWGHSFANLAMREAVICLSPALAAETRFVSRYFIDHYLLNFLLTEWAMLHASCVLDPDRQRLIVLIAPHNSGKSTTALYLLRAGYHFLADGMALLQHAENGFRVGGYPIGEVKLRDDVLALFPAYTGEAVQAREQRKTIVDLRVTHPERLVETLIVPSSINLCLVERSDAARTRISALSPSEIWPLLRANTVYWDKAPRLAYNQTALQALAQRAGLYRLELGSNVVGIEAVLDEVGLW